jgi:hypothetical protein
VLIEIPISIPADLEPAAAELWSKEKLVRSKTDVNHLIEIRCRRPPQNHFAAASVAHRLPVRTAGANIC